MSKVTLIIPAKEEANALPMVLNEIFQKKLDFDIIIVIDKKDKETYEAIKKFECKIIFQSQKGYGNAIIEGIDACETEYSCIFYADGSTDPQYISFMKQKLEKEEHDFIFGSRYEKNAYSYDDDLITRIGNFFFTFLGNFLMKFNISDILFTYIFTKTKNFKSLNLKCNDYCLCLEIPFKIKLNKFSYSSFPCIERKRFADKKKVKAFSDGMKMLIYFFKNYLSFINNK